MTENEQMQARVAVLEDWRKEHREWMTEMSKKLDAMAANVNALTANVNALRLCSQPNTCVTLREEISELATENKNAMRRIENLEKWRTFISGVVASVGVVWMLLQVVVPWALKLIETR